MRKSLKHYLKRAQKEHWALGQFNFSDFTQMKAIVTVAEKMKSPVILGTSEGESLFFGLEEAALLKEFFRKNTKLPIFLNLDHGKSIEYSKQAIDAGYDMVHFDGSKLALEENIKQTKEVVKYARRRGAMVEGEIGIIGNDSSRVYSEKFEINEQNLTDPNEAEKFVKETKVNLLAVSIGNFHGIGPSGADPNLELNLLKKIRDKVNGLPLVLHGGSGAPMGDIKEAIKLGIAKININTEIRLAFAENLRTSLNNNPEQIVPYKFLLDAQNAVEKVIEGKIILFESKNKA